MTNYYYLTVSYNIHDMALEGHSSLMGPYQSVAERDAALRYELSLRDLETSEILNVTLLKGDNGQIFSEGSYLADNEDTETDDDAPLLNDDGSRSIFDDVDK